MDIEEILIGRPKTVVGALAAMLIVGALTINSAIGNFSRWRRTDGDNEQIAAALAAAKEAGKRKDYPAAAAAYLKIEAAPENAGALDFSREEILKFQSDLRRLLQSVGHEGS